MFKLLESRRSLQDNINDITTKFAPPGPKLWQCGHYAPVKSAKPWLESSSSSDYLARGRRQVRSRRAMELGRTLQRPQTVRGLIVRRTRASFCIRRCPTSNPAASSESPMASYHPPKHQILQAPTQACGEHKHGICKATCLTKSSPAVRPQKAPRRRLAATWRVRGT